LFAQKKKKRLMGAIQSPFFIQIQLETRAAVRAAAVNVQVNFNLGADDKSCKRAVY
jgi:hypothetical protein